LLKITQRPPPAATPAHTTTTTACTHQPPTLPPPPSQATSTTPAIAVGVHPATTNENIIDAPISATDFTWRPNIVFDPNTNFSTISTATTATLIPTTATMFK